LQEEVEGLKRERQALVMQVTNEISVSDRAASSSLDNKTSKSNADGFGKGGTGASNGYSLTSNIGLINNRSFGSVVSLGDLGIIPGTGGLKTGGFNSSYVDSSTGLGTGGSLNVATTIPKSFSISSIPSLSGDLDHDFGLNLSSPTHHNAFFNSSSLKTVPTASSGLSTLFKEDDISPSITTAYTKTAYIHESQMVGNSRMRSSSGGNLTG
jgi:hypothetical protein